MMKLRRLNKRKSWSAPGFAGFLLLVAILLPIKFAAAATFTLPGSLPSGCSQASSTSYTCTNLALGWNDAIIVSNANTTLTITNTLTANGNNINTSSPASGFVINAKTVSGSNYLNLNGNLSATNNFTLSSNSNTITGNISAGGATSIGGTITGTVTTSGSLTTQWATTITGNVSASSIASGGGSTYGGSLLASSGDVVTGSSDQVAGDLTSSQGLVALGNATTVGGSVTAKNTITFPNAAAVTGSVTSTNGDVFIGNANTIGGNVTAKGKVTVSNQAVVTGNAVSENDDVVLESSNARVAGDVTAKKNITLKSGDWVNGNVSSSTQNVTLESSARVDKCVTVNSSKTITLNWHAVVTAGVCCQSGGSCSTSCVSNSSGYAMPGLCAVLPSLSVANVSANEGNSGSSTMTFTITQSATSSLTSTVNYSTSNGTTTGGASCSAGVDYVTASGSKTIAPGATTATFTVTLCGDTTYEADETFSVTLASPVNATLGTSTATGTITNDDSAPSLSIDSVSAAEGDFGTSMMTFTVTQSAISGLASSFNYASSNGTATGGASCTTGVDYITVSGSKTIPAGSTTASIDVQVCGDTTTESSETFSLTLSAPTNATLGTAVGTGTITNDDTATSQCLSQYTFTGNNGDALDSDWATTSSNGFFGQPRIYNNRLRLTDATTNVATAAHLQKKFPGAGNKIVVEFDYYAYNGTGADGIALTFSDAAITPQAGAYGGSLGYAQRTSVNGFAGGWLGVGIDEYGNFSNPTEGRDGGTGATVDSVSVRGSGSGTTGYKFHAGSSTLSPGVDQGSSTQGPGHRYRITIDHSDSLHAYVWVERSTDAGVNYSVIVAKYDAKTKTGQAAVPTEWLLSYTGSTGASTNIHEIDNLYICAAQPILPVGGPHHIRLNHTGSAITCLGEQVTVNACGGADTSGTCAANTTGLSGNVIAKSSGGTILATVPFTIAAGSSSVTVTVPVSTAQTVTFETSGLSVTPTASPAWTCWNGSAASCSNVFSDAGFIVASAADGAAEATIPTQTAATSSGASSSGIYWLRAVKTNTTTKACVSALTGSATVNLAYQCNDPTTCYTSNPPACGSGTGYLCLTPYSSNGTTPQAARPLASNDNGTLASYTAVTMNFDANGNAPFSFVYADVGKLTLHASKAAGGAQLTTLSGSTNSFLVKPYGFSVIACTGATIPCTTANTYTQTDASGTVFTSAGTVFNASISAIADGNRVTPSFGLGTGKATESVTLSNALVLPASGNGGALSGKGTSTSCVPATGVDCLYRDAFTDGVASVTNLAWSEVGVMALTATNPFLLGVTSSSNGTSGNIGRFIPDHFAITLPSLVAACSTATPFTYFGQDGFATVFTLTAQSTASTTTTNYAGDASSAASWAKLPLTAWGAAPALAGSPGFGFATNTWAPAQPLGSALLSSANAPTATNGNAWSLGTTTVTARHQITRPAAVAAPTTVAVTALPVDTDGVTTPSATALGSPQLYFGMMRLQPAIGSELRPLTMPVEILRWSGAAFVPNGDDSCTTIPAAGTFGLAGWSKNLGVGETAVLAVKQPATAPATPGRGTLSLSAPGAGNDGSVRITAGLAAPLPYLRGNWGGAANFDQNPSAIAAFGLYKGAGQVIHFRESY